MSIIQINHLTKYYGKNRGVEDLSLEVKEGDIYGFIGPNGAGKSTTIRTLLNFIFPDQGEVKIFDKDVVKHSKTIRKEIGYLPSEVYYYNNIQVKELLDYAASLKGKVSKVYMQELVDALDLDVTKKFNQLSFGNKKKVGIVQAMMSQPRLLILDEPTNGLDPLVQKTLMKMLKEQNKLGTTIFFSSHTLSVVQQMCNQIGIVKEGRMLEVETYESLREKRFKQVAIETKEPIEQKILKVRGINDLHIEGCKAQFYFNGQIEKLLHHLNDIQVVDCSIKEPDLEEMFMHFYEKETNHES